MKISVGIPIYDTKLQMQTVAALLTETSIATSLGDELRVRFLPSCCNLALGRNQLVKEFLDSSDERLVFLDADITFEPGALIKIAHQKADFVGGAYRLKQETENYPVGWIPGDLWSNKDGLIEVAMLPTGFLSLSRNVFSRFREAYPGREYEISGQKRYCYFQIPYREGQLYTEDAYFCREWKAMGEEIFLDPNLLLTHWDQNKPYQGHIGNWLRRLNHLNKEQ